MLFIQLMRLKSVKNCLDLPALVKENFVQNKQMDIEVNSKVLVTPVGLGQGGVKTSIDAV